MNLQQFLVTIRLACLLSILASFICNTAHAQNNSPFGEENPFGQSIQPGQKSYKRFIFHDLRLQRELEITTKQRRQLFELRFECEGQNLDLSEEIDALNARLEEAADDSNRQKLKAKLAKLKNEKKGLAYEFETRAREDILLPHQIRLIERIELIRSVATKKGFFKSLHLLTEHFEIKQDKRDRIGKIIERHADELNKQLLNTFREAKQEVLEEFSELDRQEIGAVYSSFEHRENPNPKYLMLEFEKYYWKRASELKRN